MTRWRVSALPSPALPVPGVGRHRWLVELIRARAGESADFELEACDDTGCLALPAHMVDRSRAQEGWRSEEHTSELQSLMRISYAVFCLKKKNKRTAL